jgi:uncharacterized repeat protein (TIGR01451 family)
MYQFTPAGAWLADRIHHSASGAKLVPEDAPVASGAALSKSDLDAVASAWAGAAPVKPAEATPDQAAAANVVRDEQVAPANYTAPVDAVDDTKKPSTNSGVAHAVAATESNAPEVSPLPADDRYAANDSKHPTPAPLDLSSVTRGQAPDEGSFDASPVDPSTAKTSAAGADARHASSSQRARDAFRDNHATAAKSADDRYTGASASAGRDQSIPAETQGLNNPFSAQPAMLPTASDTVVPMPQTSSAPTAIASPSPFGTDGGGNPATGSSPSRSQPEAIRAASSTYSGAPIDAGTSRCASLSGSAEGPYGGGQSSYGQTSTGPDGTGRPGERALEGPQKPSVVIQKFAPAEIQVGKPAKFTVQVRNVGSQTAAEVVIRDEVPQGTKLVSTTPRADVDGSHLSWSIGSLSTGEEKTVQIELMPTAEGDIGSVAGVTYAAQASAKTHCTMPQLAIRMTAPSQVMIGQDEHVKIELRNPGTGDATGVMLLENVPENVKHVAGPSLEFEVGTLHAGETREMDLVLTAQKAGKVVNALTARADGNLQIQQQVEFEVIAPALQVSVDGPEKRYLERPATYQVSVQNPGTAPAHDIELMTKLPKGMKFVRANNMGQYDATTHAVYWSLAELPEGEKGTVELVAMPVEAGQQTLEVQGKAQQGLADQTKRDVVVEGIAAIMFEVRDTEDPIEVNGETTYEIRVVNQGSKAATNVQVVVSLPPGLQFVSASGETHFSAERGGIVFAPLKQLAPKADTVYRVQVKGTQPGDQRVTVQVNTDDISQPIRREESTRVFGDQ